MHSATISTFLALAMFAIFALIGGGAYVIFRKRDRLRGALMIAAAIVLLGNVLILTWPA